MLEVRTLVLVRELAGGDVLAAPIASLSLAAHGVNEAAAVDELRSFLNDHLAYAPAETVARFANANRVTGAAPPSLREVSVLVERDDLPRKAQVRAPIAIPCVIVPSASGVWVTILPLNETIHFRAEEDLDAAVEREVARIVGAREPSPWEHLQLFPARDHRLLAVGLNVSRIERLPAGRVRSLRKLVEDRERAHQALEVLASVATPVTPRGEASPALVGRDADVKQLRALLGAPARSAVLITGPGLSGKTSLFEAALDGVASPAFATSATQLVAGMHALGQWQERVQRVLDAAATLDAILYFDNLADLLADGGSSHVDLAGAMKRHLEEGRVRIVGELRDDVAAAVERHKAGFFAYFTRVHVPPLGAERAAEALRARAEHDRRARPDASPLDPRAVHPIVDLCERYLPYEAFPGKAMRLYDEVRVVHEQAGRRGPIGPDVVYECFSVRSGVPSFLLRADRALLVEEVAARLAARVVGQAGAVRAVAETVCVVKAELQPAGKPLASFLFIGPTGVGKTELARSLAEFLFGSQDRLVRFDMSEFTGPDAALRLIRGSDRAEGLLTRKIREQPFTVVLLDEIEKAHPAVFDLLLQVCGEGRLSDGRGRTTYFHNAILIMTSNLGAGERPRIAGFGDGAGARGDRARYQRAVDEAFRPEFVNRMDRIVLFAPLTRDEIRRVARLALDRIAARRGLVEARVRLDVGDAALDHLAERGYSATYGARALRRYIEETVTAKVAELLAKLGEDLHGATIEVGEGAALRVVADGARRPRAAAELGPLSRVRRDVDRVLGLGRVVEVRQRLASILSELSYGAARTDARTAREIAELRSEYHRLGELWGAVEAVQGEIHALEDLAFQAALDGEEAAPLVEEAAAQGARFRRALAPLLVADERRRDHAVLLVTDLDEGTGWERWLAPLLRATARRRWSAWVHVDGGERARADEWPAERRWGPPRSPSFVLERLARDRVPFRHVLLRVSGANAGAYLALEAGLHRWSGVSRDVPHAHLHVQLVAMRAALGEEDWSARALVPEPPTSAEERKKLGPARAVDLEAARLLLAAGRRALPFRGDDAYFDDLEEIAAEHLLLFEADGEAARDDVFRAPLDEG